MALTGRFWFRKSWRGKLVLVVEERKPRWLRPRSSYTVWRDATLLDFAEMALRPLVMLEHSHRSAHEARRPAVVHTLDSATNPAAEFGVRDVDLQVHTHGRWRTVRSVRGNTAGVISASFAAVRADRVRMVTLDSNDHKYSRIVELEEQSRRFRPMRKGQHL